MILPDQIIRSNRRTLSLSINKDGQIIIHAPNKMEQDIINNFVKEKQQWLTNKLAIIRNNQDRFCEILNLKKYLLYGKQLAIYKADIKKIEVVNDKLLVPNKLDNNKISSNIINFYKKQAKEVLHKRLIYLQDILKIRCNSFKICNSKGRWGSCSSAGAVTLNWRVIMVDPQLIDYIIIHELCHLVEMNHSKRFWTLVATFLPNYNQYRQDLKEYGFLLELYRK